NLSDKPTKIWLGTTNQADLSAGWIPSTQLTLVFDGNITYPSGANTITIPLQTPYMHTPGNLVMMVERPMDTQYYSSSDNFQAQTIGTARALKVQSDSTDYDPANPPAGTTPSGQFPKTTIFYTGQAIVNDLGCLTISGNSTPSVGDATPYTITVKNNGTAVQSNYTVKLMKEGGILLGSVPGVTINSLQTLDFTINWTPTATGATYIYGEVEMTGDEITTNNQTPHLNVNVYPEGTVAITVGTGNSTDRMPMDFYWKNSLFETIYLASELNIGGLLTDIQFYNNFVTNLTNKPTNIWVGETTQTDLSAGWIPSTQLTQVFSGNVNYPNGQNDILIHLTTPYAYGGGNLVVMVERPMDTQYFSSSDLFRTQTGTVANRTRKVQSDSVDYDPANPPTATPTAMFPMATFMFITEGLGAINGTVYGPGDVPLVGATVVVEGTNLSYTTGADGTFTFPYVAQGEHQVTASKYGYYDVTNTVTVIEDQTVTTNFTLTPLPQVTVTGRIVGSDQPTVGLADATINLSGYESYQATTNTTGNFTITNVYASHTYDYVASAMGYQNATGQVVVGTTDVNMGDIVVNEMAFPPSHVVATEATDGTNVTITWNIPTPGENISEGFEGTLFPPENWSQIITDNGPPVGAGILPTWCQAGTIALTPAVPPHSGSYQAAMWWDYNHQDEWLITPQFICPADADLTFWSYVYLGSTNGDHYYIKVSTDNGNTWTVLWDASTLTGGWNYYATPIVVPLSNYAGQQIKLAWHADDPPSADGMWYVWFVDDVSVGNAKEILRFPTSSLTRVSASDSQSSTPLLAIPDRPASRALANSPILRESNDVVYNVTRDNRVLTGYKVYRLLSADQSNENLWTPLTPTTITNTSYVDNSWAPLPSGVYRFAVKAVYTNNVLSPAAFSNEIHKGMMGTLTGTVTEFGTNVPIEGATITAGEYSGTSNAQGVYSFSVYQGTYTVTCSKPGYQTATQTGVNIVGLQTTTVNFVLTEITLPPAAVQATEVNQDLVNLTWMAPGTGTNITEGFEGTTFPPTDWSQIITDNGPPVGAGILPTWCQAGTIALTPAVPPHGGSYQAAMWWDWNHQDEWLITPQFVCPGGTLTFWSYVYLGSTNGDHYYIKISTDNGNTWTVLWDASTLTGGWNYYATPIVIDLDSYAGQQIKLAWHAEDPPSNDGMWYVWFVDDVTVGNAKETIHFPINTLTRVSANDVADREPQIVTPQLPTSRARANTSIIQSTRQIVQEPIMRNDRVLNGYKVWRLLQGQETNESAWTLLTTDVITATAYQDYGWGSVPDGMYKWAVKAVYTGGALSNPAFSIALPKITEIGTIAGTVKNQQNAPIMGATVTCGDVTATTNTSGAYSMQVPAGTHSVTASATGYDSVTQDNVIVVTGQTTTVNFILPPSSTIIILEDSFETYENFALTFAPWTCVDVDLSATYGISGVSFPNCYAPMAYIIFVPSATTPPLTATDVTHTGTKIAASFAATSPPNNDWLITPVLHRPTQITFWARSYVTDYGMERFKVGVSTTGTNPSNFTIISGPNYIEAPAVWTEYTYAIDGQPENAYIGIQCVSNDAFIFLLDDVTVEATPLEDPTVPVLATELQGNYPNPFNPETTIRYSVKETVPVTIEVYNLKGQLVRTLVNEVKTAGNYSVVWNGRDSHNQPVSSGVYFYKMNAGKYSNTKKMIMMK
ncbi:MAG: choice-of-anchor J domain-containing protein, partial [Candidatus Cloacimonadaceae bacterium]